MFQEIWVTDISVWILRNQWKLHYCLYVVYRLVIFIIINEWRRVMKHIHPYAYTLHMLWKSVGIGLKLMSRHDFFFNEVNINTIWISSFFNIYHFGETTNWINNIYIQINLFDGCCAIWNKNIIVSEMII